jgi:phospholipid/cholesterol/gamma-HCH transport system substrate-binding protein
MKKINNEFKVGLFFVICIIGLFYLSYRTGKLNFKKEGYCIYAKFDDIAGLQKKAPVMLNGLEVGKVEDIKISYDNGLTNIILKLWLEKNAKVRNNPVVSIKTLGLMGEKYIQIASSQGSDFISAGSVVYGKTYQDFDAVSDQLMLLSKEVEKLTKNLNGAVEDNKENVANIINNLETTSENFESLSADLKQHPWKLLFKTKEKKAK